METKELATLREIARLTKTLKRPGTLRTAVADALEAEHARIRGLAGVNEG